MKFLDEALLIEEQLVKWRRYLHLIGSEDFANISDRVPSCYFVLGAGDSNPDKRLSQHNPKIVFDESVMTKGAAIYAQIAYDWLESNS